MLTKEQFITVKTTWKLEKEHTVHEHIIYNILRGKSADEGFVPLTDWGRLHASQNNPWFNYDNAILELRYRLNEKRYGYEGTVKHYSEVFGIDFTPDLVAAIVVELKTK